MITRGKNLPLILQAETQECALACLAMILGFHGRFIELQQLRQRFPGGQPLTLEQLCGLAQEQGLTTRALRGEPEDLAELRLPAIVHVDFDHYLVIESLGAESITVADPASGKRSMSLAEFGKRFTGIVLELEPGASFAPQGTRRRYSPAEMLTQLPMAGITPALLQLFVLSLCVQIMALGLPFFIQIVIDEVIYRRNQDLLIVITVGFAALYLVSAVTQWIRDLLALHLASRLAFNMGAALTHHILQLPLAFYSRRSVGDLVSRAGSLQPLQQFLTEGAPRLLIDALMLAGTFVGIATYSGPAAVWTLVVSILLLLAVYGIYGPYRRYSHEGIMHDANLQSQFIESIQSIAFIRRNETAAKRLQTWLNRFADTLNARLSAARWAVLFEIIRFVLTGALILGVVTLSIKPVQAGDMTVGMLFTLTAFTNHFAAAALSLTQGWQEYLMLSLHVQRLSDLTETAAEDRYQFPAEPIKRLDIQDAGFSYPGQQNDLFSGISLTATGNMNIAISGPSGLGKSTLLRTLLGEHALTRGVIAINGRPVTESLNVYPVCACLLQSDLLISGSISENIAFQSATADMQKVALAARLACIEKDVLELPMAWDEPVGEMGERLSAGQRQRLLIARTLYQCLSPQTRLLLLDECTSHLDTVTADKVMNHILALPGICIFVTHDRRLIAKADQLINLDADTALTQKQFTA